MATVKMTFKKTLFVVAFLLLGNVAFAANDGQVSSGLVNSEHTYVINDQGESVQEYGIGQLVYIVVDSKESKDKKHKDFYRVTFDPTNIKGDGWIQRDKVKLMTTYRSIDGKEPAEYERKAAPVASRTTSTSASAATGGSGSGASDASSFLEELIKKDEQKPELKSLTQDGAPQPEVAAKPAEKNPLENDLEFLFEQDGEFKKTMKETKASVKASMQKKIAVSKFSAGGDTFANQILDQFASKLQKDGGLASLPRVGFSANLDDPSTVSISKELDGVFYGQISPKIGDARLLKIKYYDRDLKQFTFEKVAKIPLTDPTKTIETLAHDCYQFVSK